MRLITFPDTTFKCTIRKQASSENRINKSAKSVAVRKETSLRPSTGVSKVPKVHDPLIKELQLMMTPQDNGSKNLLWFLKA